MNRKEMNLVNMFKTVDLFMDVNNDLLKIYNPIIESHNRLKQGVLFIDNLFEKQATDTKAQTSL